jgi:outer membrane protein TolC
MFRARSFFTLPIAALTLAGCATYHAEPLPDDPGLLRDLTMARVAGAGVESVDLADGINPDEAAVLAVLNNPELRAARAKAGVADAQLFAAGLFPDPQVTAGYDEPTSGGPDQVRAYTFGIAADIAALLTHGPAKQSAQAAAKQARLDVVWQEWQVAEQARLTATRYAYEAKKLALLDANQRALAARADEAAAALTRGDLTVDVAATYRTALLDAASAAYQVHVQHADTGHALKALFGLEPDAALDIRAAPVPIGWPPVDWNAVAMQRPDLLALQAGYESQEARLRQAVWAQFPIINLSWDRLRDNSNVWSSGFSLVMNLPFFSGGRGDVALQRATREQLREEYQARLAQSRADVAHFVADGALQQAQLQLLTSELPGLEKMVEQAETGARGGDLAAITASNLRATLVTKQIELLDVEEALTETHIALDTLIGRVQR